MKRLTLFFTACLMAVLAAAVANIRAQQTDTNDRTFITFSNAVELPGVTLEPGTYEFRLAPMSDSRDVVQVLRKDDSKVMGQWNFVQAQRDRISEDTVVMFKEAREGSTPAVQYWYYPGEKIGKEFIYPKDQAQRIAARTGQAVKTADGTVTAGNASNSTPAQSTSASASAATSSDKGDQSDQQVASDLRNAQPSSQPSAAGGSLTGNRGIPPESNASAATNTDNPPSLSASANTTAQTPPAVEPSTPAERSVGTSGNTAADASAAQRADRPVGTSGQAQADATPGPAPAAELPKTASELPLSALVGALSLMAALSLRALRA
jgi:hypothetical protein